MEQLVNVSTVAEVELIYKSRVKPSERPQIKSSKDCYQLIMHTWDKNKIEFIEQFKVLLLNRANRVLGIYEASTGGLDGTVAELRLIFTAALKSNAVCIMLCHNHPSGNLKPSRHDELLTQRVKQAGQLLDITLLDHLIIHTEGYYSFADEGLL